MATVLQVPPRAKRRARDPFYPAMALAIAIVVAVGFGPTYTASLAPPGLPFWVHLHGLVMVSWVLLFGVQSWLVRGRNLKLHRTLGYGSIGLIAAMVPLAIATDMLAVKRDAVPRIFTPAAMMATDWVDLAFFVVLFAAAILLRKRPEWHKRLLLTGTVLLTLPAWGRMPFLRGVGFGHELGGAILGLFALALAGPIHDLARRGRVHPAYFWAIGAMVISQPLHSIVAASAPMQALAARLAPTGG